MTEEVTITLTVREAEALCRCAQLAAAAFSPADREFARRVAMRITGRGVLSVDSALMKVESALVMSGSVQA